MPETCPGIYPRKVLNKHYYKSSTTDMGIVPVWGTWEWSSKNTGKFWLFLKKIQNFQHSSYKEPEKMFHLALYVSTNKRGSFCRTGRRLQRQHKSLLFPVMKSLLFSPDTLQAVLPTAHIPETCRSNSCWI